MDVNSLYYFLELSKDLNITRTAKRIFISQQTLSNHILRLEEYFGTPLLYRKPKMKLTLAGEKVLEFSKNIHEQSGNLGRILGDIKQEQQGIIKFGGSSIRLNSCLPHIFPTFVQKYPGVEFQITDSISFGLESLILEGELDCAIVLDHEKNADIISQPLMDDMIYICVTENLLREYYGDDAEKLKKRSVYGADLKDFKELPFFMMNNRIGYEIKSYFDSSGIKYRAYMTGSRIELAMLICFRGIAAGFLPQTKLADEINSIPDNINIFPLFRDGLPMKQSLSLIHHKDRYLPGYVKYFDELIIQYFSELELVKVQRAA